MCFSDESVVPMRHGTPSHKTNARLSDRGITSARMTERSLSLSHSPSLSVLPSTQSCGICEEDVQYAEYEQM